MLGAFENDDPQKGAHRGVVYALAPSYVHRGTIWAGTDDGLVWITHDASTNSAQAHWTNVTPPGLTPWSKIAQIDASRFDDDTAFVAVNRFRLDDLRPYVYVTHDGGRTWKLSVSGLPEQPVNAVRQDPVVQNLLYAATENGVYVSFDGAATWQSLQNDLPHTSMRDIVVHDNDLIVATHGRGFWILDDIEPLRELASGVLLSLSKDGTRPDDAASYLFAPERAYRVRRSTNTDTPLPPEEPMGENPPDGAIVDYALAGPAHRVVLSFYDRSGRLVRSYASNDDCSGCDPASRQARLLGAALRDARQRQRECIVSFGICASRHRWRQAKICRSRRCRTTRRAFPKARWCFRAFTAYASTSMVTRCSARSRSSWILASSFQTRRLRPNTFSRRG